MIRNKVIFGLTVALAFIIAYLSLSPKPAVTASNDKLGHFIAYSTLAFFALRSFHLITNRRVLEVLLMVILFGLLMELGQLFVPGRSFSKMDIVANISGALLGWIIYGLLQKTRSKYI